MYFKLLIWILYQSNNLNYYFNLVPYKLPTLVSVNWSIYSINVQNKKKMLLTTHDSEHIKISLYFSMKWVLNITKLEYFLTHNLNKTQRTIIIDLKICELRVSYLIKLYYRYFEISKWHKISNERERERDKV